MPKQTLFSLEIGTNQLVSIGISITSKSTGSNHQFRGYNFSNYKTAPVDQIRSE